MIWPRTRTMTPPLLVLSLVALGTSCGESVAPASPDASGASVDSGVLSPDGSVGRPDSGELPPVGDAGLDPCQPNPCTDVAGHRTRCLWDGEGGYDCHCEFEYHESSALCCPRFSDNVGGTCACWEDYAEVAGQCLVKCTEDSVEGLHGWCPVGQLCVQGVCETDRCVGQSCPEHSTCVTRMDAAFCLCDEGFHLSEDLCCQLNASKVGAACACDSGFVLQGGECLPDPTNPCLPTNPCESGALHRNTCVQDGSAQGYHCDCNPGYEESAGACVLTVLATCPTGLVCRNEVCVPSVLTQEQCVYDSDCQEFPGSQTTCNASAAGGICLGCIHHSDCPGNSQCMSWGSCALMCDSDADCPYGRCYEDEGFCGQTRCSSDADCFNGTVCIDDNGDGQGLCLRIPCEETECSPSNPTGSCPQSNQSCLYGACTSSCSPSPCDEELNKTVCSAASGVPACLCDSGYELAADGRCLPAASTCPTDFTCGNGYCADRAAPEFACQQDSDCGTGLTCSPTLPSGSCRGCGSAACPAGFDCISGYCLQPCALHSDCHPQMICRGTGYCGRKECASGAECDAPYLCVAGTSGGAATCQRPTCTSP